MARPLPTKPTPSTWAAPLPPLKPEPAFCLAVRIPPQQILNLHMALRRVPAGQAQSRIAAIGKQYAVTVIGSRAEVDAAMSAIMRNLPQAEFGPIRMQAAS